MSSQDVSTAGSKDLETTTLVIASLVDRLNELTKELHELAKEALRGINSSLLAIFRLS